MNCNVFTYGSLMFPEVWQRVVCGRYRQVQAILHDHARFAVVNASYPGMVASVDAQVEGIVYFNVTPEDIAALDAFEGSDYRRERVQLVLASGEKLAADTYIYVRPAHLSAAPWHPQTFQIEYFLQTYCPTGSEAGKPV